MYLYIGLACLLIAFLRSYYLKKKLPIFNFHNCDICIYNIKRAGRNETMEELLVLIYNHTKYYINEKSFDNEFKVKKLFQEIVLHCTPKKHDQIQKTELYNLYLKMVNENKITKNILFEKLVIQNTNKDSNGENCMSCPSQFLSSCAYKCSFCPSSAGIAKSYAPGQASFDKLIQNDNNFILYLLQHMLSHHLAGHSIHKLAMRHLGGTFHSYPELYRYEYSRDIFYCVNVISDIINNEEMLTEAKKYIKGKFVIPDGVRKYHLYHDIINYKDMDSFQDIEDIDISGKDIGNLIKIRNNSIILELVKQSLKYEQNINISAPCRIVSYSIETRPDAITKSPNTIYELLDLGVTIVEFGLQSTDNELLKINKRGHNAECSAKAIRIIKDAGLHVHGQWMMDLPGSTWEKEVNCIKDILSDEFRCDQIKIYPHLSMPGTETKIWLDEGKYKSLAEENPDKFIELVAELLTRLDETVRVNRVQRDLPKKSLRFPDGYTNEQPSNLEQLVSIYMEKNKMPRNDIRSCEPRQRFARLNEINYYVSVKPYTGGYDFFISAESSSLNKKILWGYSRLSLCNYELGLLDKQPDYYLDIFNNFKCGRIRELKVNGSISAVGANGNAVQHRGIGSKLLKYAEQIAAIYGMDYVTVTSAVGVRDYYKNKHGYQLDDCGLMIKKVTKNSFSLLPHQMSTIPLTQTIIRNTVLGAVLRSSYGYHNKIKLL